MLVLSANLIEQEALLGLAAAALMIGEVAIILVAGPIYFLDCTDGHGLTRCSLPMIVRAGLTTGQPCGDLGW